MSVQRSWTVLIKSTDDANLGTSYWSFAVVGSVGWARSAETIGARADYTPRHVAAAVILLACFAAFGEAGVDASCVGSPRIKKASSCTGIGMGGGSEEEDVVERVDLRLRVDDLELMEVIACPLPPPNSCRSTLASV